MKRSAWFRATRLFTFLLAVGFFVRGDVPAACAQAKADPAAITFFETRIRPLLAERCYECHGPTKQKGKLRLDSLESMLKGGRSGPAIKPGLPEESLLVRAIRHREELQMPPKAKLPAREIADLTAWIKMGAPWPNAVATKVLAPSSSGATFTKEQRSFWAFQSPVAAKLPAVRDIAWVRSPIDRFILSELENKGLRPAPPADRRTLLRRATFDLTGLPPTQEEIAAFLADTAPGAFARVIDGLLASPHYGERWGRRWLDVARYADSNGMDENLTYGNAFRYRDYVVRAFNQDKPYDQFVREQLAGDLLPAATPSLALRVSVSTPTRSASEAVAGNDGIIATGFLCIGPKMLAEDDPVKMQMDIIDEQVDTTGRTFMGLTLGCARCHDHKYDPISMADYYGLAGVFKSTKTMDNFSVVARWQERVLGSQSELERKKDHDRRIAQKKAAIDQQIQSANKQLLAKARAKAAQDSKGPFPLPANAESLYPAATAALLKTLRAELSALQKSAPILPEAMGASDTSAVNLRIHLRGSHLTLGEEVPRRFPSVFTGPQPASIDPKHSGRLELACWLTEPGHPLTGRVMVNRIWLGHFGAGLVRSPDNFGLLGDRPVHQPLLDWLAVRFVQGGWSIKSMHRDIMLSSTYQMSTAHDEQAALADPDNRLHWRMNRRRLEAESLRDAVLAVSGQLDRTMGGSIFEAKNRAYVPGYPNANYDKYDSRRRSIYLPVIRSDLYNVFQAFDFPDPSVANGERASTTVAPQALFMMNSKFMQEQTRALAAALLAETRLDDAGHIALPHERIYGRPVLAKETARALDFVRRVEAALPPAERDGGRRLQAWQSLCRVLLAANEFVYVE